MDPTLLFGVLLLDALMIIFVLWVRKRGSPWAGAIILVIGIVGLVAELMDTEIFAQGFGIARGTLLIDLGEIAGLIWLARALRYAASHGGNFRTVAAEPPLAG